MTSLALAAPDRRQRDGRNTKLQAPGVCHVPQSQQDREAQNNFTPLSPEDSECKLSLVSALCTVPLQPTELWMTSAKACAVATAVTGLQRALVTVAAAAVALPARRAALAAAAAAAALALEFKRAAWRQFRIAVDCDAACEKAVTPPAYPVVALF